MWCCSPSLVPAAGLTVPAAALGHSLSAEYLTFELGELEGSY